LPVCGYQFDFKRVGRGVSGVTEGAQNMRPLRNAFAADQRVDFDGLIAGTDTTSRLWSRQ